MTNNILNEYNITDDWAQPALDVLRAATWEKAMRHGGQTYRKASFDLLAGDNSKLYHDETSPLNDIQKAITRNHLNLLLTKLGNSGLIENEDGDRYVKGLPLEREITITLSDKDLDVLGVERDKYTVSKGDNWKAAVAKKRAKTPAVSVTTL